MPFMETERSDQKSTYRWVVLGVSLFAFVAYAFAFQSFPPLIPSVKVEFHVSSDAVIALAMSVVLIPGILLSLPAGFLLGKYRVRTVGTLSLLGVVLGSVVSALANSFSMLLIGRFILGLGGAFVTTATSTLITQWFSREDLGKAMGLFGINMPLATVIALPTSSLLSTSFGWRFPFHISSVVGVVSMIVFLTMVKAGPLTSPKKKGPARTALLNTEIWKVGFAWLFFNAVALSFTTWAPTLFEEFRGIPRVQASFLASLLMWAALFCVPIYGYLSDRTGRRKPFALLGFILMAGALILTGLSSGLILVASVLLLGISAAMVPAIMSTLPPQILGPTLASIGFGITNTCMNIGATIVQPSIGLVKDLTQSYAPCFLAMAVFAAAGIAMAYTLRIR